MSDTIVRHLIAFFGTFVAFLAYFSGYLSGSYGWWWTAIGLVAIYAAIYSLVNA